MDFREINAEEFKNLKRQKYCYIVTDENMIKENMLRIMNEFVDLFKNEGIGAVNEIYVVRGESINQAMNLKYASIYRDKMFIIFSFNDNFNINNYDRYRIKLKTNIKNRVWRPYEEEKLLIDYWDEQEEREIKLKKEEEGRTGYPYDMNRF